MIDIGQYLKSHKKEIVTYINDNYISNNITSNPTFNELASELQAKFEHDHSGTVGGRDQAHNVLTMAIMCGMWCGWLSQAKAKRGVYPQEWVDSFKKAIIDAFEIGQEYVKEKP